MVSQRMVSLFFISVLLLLTALPNNLFAYNADGRIHFEGSFEVLDRDIEEENSQFLGQVFPKERTSIESLRLLGKLSFRVVDPVEIYGLLGGSDLELKDFDFSSDFSTAYGGGLRVVLFRDKSPELPYQVFADYLFLRFKTHATIFFQPIDANGFPIPAGNSGELVNEKVVWDEHVLKLGVLARHDVFEPYGGIRFSFVHGKDHIPSQFQTLDLHFKQSDTFGIFGGVSYYLSRSEQAAVFIEGSLFDQYSLTGGIRVGF